MKCYSFDLHKSRQLPVNQHLVNQITSEVLKKSPITKLYLWMSNPEGKFIFGVPYPVFASRGPGGHLAVPRAVPRFPERHPLYSLNRKSRSGSSDPR